MFAVGDPIRIEHPTLTFYADKVEEIVQRATKTMEKLIAEGYPMVLTYPSEGTGYEVACVSMVAGGPEEEYSAAKVLFDWMLTEEAAQIMADNMIVPFVESDLAAGVQAISDVNTIAQDDEWNAANRQRLVEEWNVIIGGEGKTQ